MAFPDDRLDLRIELAFGADLTADPSGWTWTDVGADLTDDEGKERLFAQDVTVTRGRADESSSVQPASVTFVLDNIDGHLTPHNPASKWWPNVVKGTPCRVSVPHPGGGRSYRFTGHVGSIIPDWEFGEPGSDLPDAVVTITASGILRSLGRRSTPLRSALYRYWTAQTVPAYWPMEGGGDDARTSPVDGVRPVGVYGGLSTGGVTFESLASGPGLALTSGSGGSWNAPIPNFSITNGRWSVSVLVKIDSLTSSGTDTVLQVHTTDNGVDAFISVRVTTSGFEARFGLPSGTTTTAISSSGAIGEEIVVYVTSDGSPPIGGPVYVAGWYMADRAESASVAAAAADGRPRAARGSGNASEIGWAHLVVQPGTSLPSFAGAYVGWVAETAVDRVERLCAEAAIDVVTPGRGTGTDDLSILMGAQRSASLITLLQECADTDFGILGEQRDTLGLEYRTHQTLYNQTPVLALDAAADGVSAPLSGTEDDQPLVNDVTSTNSSTGGERNRVDSDSIALNGLYDISTQVSVAADGQLDDDASWRLHLGTWPELRYPTLTMDLALNPSLIDAWLDLSIGDRVTVDNLPASHPPGLIDQLVQQTRETMSSLGWTVQFVGTPAGAWTVGKLDDVALGRADTAGAELNGAITDSATSVSVETTTGPVWVDTAGHASEFPFDIEIGGEVMTVTAISGTASPQTFTVTRSINGVVKSHADGAAVTLAQPLVLSL